MLTTPDTPTPAEGHDTPERIWIETEPYDFPGYSPCWVWHNAEGIEDADGLVEYVRAAPPSPIIPLLIAVARAAWHALDNSESRTEEGEEVTVLAEPWAEELNIALTALDMLPDDPSGRLVETGPAKAERLLARPAPSDQARALREAVEQAADVLDARAAIHRRILTECGMPEEAREHHSEVIRFYEEDAAAIRALAPTPEEPADAR